MLSACRFAVFSAVFLVLPNATPERWDDDNIWRTGLWNPPSTRLSALVAGVDRWKGLQGRNATGNAADKAGLMPVVANETVKIFDIEEITMKSMNI